MATGDRINLAGVNVQTLTCAARPSWCEATFKASAIIALVNDPRMLSILIAAAAAAKLVDVTYVESKPVPFDAVPGTVRKDLLVNVTFTP